MPLPTCKYPPRPNNKSFIEVYESESIYKIRLGKCVCKENTKSDLDLDLEFVKIVNCQLSIRICQICQNCLPSAPNQGIFI